MNKYEEFVSLLGKSMRYEINDGILTISDYYTGKEIKLNLYGIDEETFSDILVVEDDEDNEEEFEELCSKTILDSDGFTTQYTLYKSLKYDNCYVCMFGDKELYHPSVDDADYVTEDLNTALSWFNSYKGFEE